MRKPRSPRTQNFRFASLHFLLESVVGGEQVSRYSFVGCNPRKVIACHEDETVVTERNGERHSFPTPADPLDIVEQEMAGIRYAAIDDLPRFAGGAVGYVGYEYASRIEPTVPLAEKDELGLPTLYFLIADLVLIFDHARQTLSICANAYVGDNPAADHAEAAARIADTVKQLSVPSPLLPAELDSVEAPDPPEGNFSKEEFEALVDTDQGIHSIGRRHSGCSFPKVCDPIRPFGNRFVSGDSSHKSFAIHVSSRKRRFLCRGSLARGARQANRR